MDSEKIERERPDCDWDYWEAQLEGFEKSFKKPILRDIQTHKAKMDKVHDFAWKEIEQS